MSRPTAAARRRPTAGRRGTILVVVLALLAIFAVIGIAFVFYSDGEMTAARYNREAESRNGNMRPTMSDQRFASDAETALAAVIFGDYSGQVTNPLYTSTPPNGQLDGFRGHSLLGAMYGENMGSASGTHPYTGQGIFHEKMTAPFDTIPSRGHVVNYNPMVSGTDAKGNPVFTVFDPEVTGPPRSWSAITAPPAAPAQPPWSVTTAGSLGSGQTYVSKAAPYTYPDLNNFYLASVVPATGETVLPSFFRPWHFNTANPNLNMRLFPWNPADTAASTATANNTDWVTVEGRARILRPRPIDQLSPAEFQAAGIPNGRIPTTAELTSKGYPVGALFNLIDGAIRNGTTINPTPIINYPRPNADSSITGDVFNLIGDVGVQKNDSILVDFGAPSFEWPLGSGKQVKPLAAVMIRDLDGLLHLNAHGNLRNNGQHASHHGLGPWEVNLALGVGWNTNTTTQTANVAEMNEVVRARYGKTGSPAARNGTTSLAYAGSAGRFTSASQVAWGPMGSAAPLQIPTFTAATGLNPSPFFVTAQYPPTGVYYDNTKPPPPMPPAPSNDPETAHPALYNPGEWVPFPNGQTLNPLPATDNYGATNPGFSYPVADTRRLHERYAGALDLYRQMTLFRLQNPPLATLVGDGATYAPGTAPPTPNPYRNDPAHGRRLLTTTVGNDIDRPRFMSGPGGNATLSTGLHAVNSGLTSNPAGTLPLGSSATPPPALDINRPLADYRDLSVAPNVSPDPSDPTMKKTIQTPQPLGSGNMGNKDQAWADRQNLARDIFARLITATGGNAKVDPSTGDVLWNTSTGTDWSKLKSEDKDAIRYLAQLAVNIVDYVDTDDVSTMFVFRPAGTKDLTVVDASNVAQTVKDAVTEANGNSPANVGDYVVYGVEMPRLVINEVYSEVTDDPVGKMGKGKGSGPPADGHVRFWVELLNPSANPYSGGTAGVLGDGSVSLNPGGGVTPYKLVMTRAKKNGTNAADLLTTNANVDGSLPAAYGSADTEYDFRDAGPNMKTGVDNSVVKPNNGKYDPAGNPTDGIVLAGPQVTGANPSEEFDPTNGGMPAAPWNNMIQSTALATADKGKNKPAMEYIIDQAKLGALTPDDTQHIVLLRRLANPYLPYDADGTGPMKTINPYVTVDVMNYVPANDAVYTGNGGGPNAGGVPMKDRFSVGRVQPMAGQAKPDAGMAGSPPAYTFPNSFLLAQVDNGTATQPKHTLGRHNGKSSTAPTAGTYLGPQPAMGATPATGPTMKNGETIMAAFDWFIHLDRPVVNELELLYVQAVKPSQVTQYTFQPPKNATGEDVRRNLGLAPWLGVDPASGDPTYEPASGLPSFQITSGTPTANTTANGLYRALELLRVKSRVWGTASGGRVAGKVNINTVQDARVLLALLDPQSSNAFTAAEVYNAADPTDKTTIWGRFIGTRTKNLSPATTTSQLYRTLADGSTVVATTFPGKTIDDDPYDTNWQSLDRPFKSFGVAEAGMTANNTGTIVGGGNTAANDGSMPPKGPNPTPFGPGLQDTLLRADPSTRQPYAYTSGSAATHPYLKAEALRKLAGNVTTVSNTFAVHVTIVYHYVRTDTSTNPPSVMGDNIPNVGVRAYLSSEAFREVPGDMRQQYFAIVDRSNAMVTPNTPLASPLTPSTLIVAQPFQAATKTAVSGGTTANLTLTSYTVSGNNLIVFSDGQLVSIGQNSVLYIGSGTNAQQFTVNSVNPPPMGATDYTLSITLSSGSGTAFNNHPPGSLISNGVTGRPGAPSGNFTPFQTPGTFPYTGLVPYSARVR